MKDEPLENLIQELLNEKDGSYRKLVNAIAQREVETWLTVAAHESVQVRRAAVEAARGNVEPQVINHLKTLATDRSKEVRQTLAVALADEPGWPVDVQILSSLMSDEEWEVRSDAIRAAGARKTLPSEIMERLQKDDAWQVRESAAKSLGTADPRSALGTLLIGLAKDDDEDVKKACAHTLEANLTNDRPSPSILGELPDSSCAGKAQSGLESIGDHRYPTLRSWLAEVTEAFVDVAALATIGVDLTAQAESGELPRAFGVERLVQRLKKTVTSSSNNRSVVLLGPSGAGKTAVVQELVHALCTEPDTRWRVLRVSPSDLVAGTLYVGEWETKVKELIQNAKTPKKVVLYVPNLEGLSQVGTSSKSDTNAAAMLAPYIESGALAVVGESVPEPFEKGLGRNSSLRRLFTRVDIAPATKLNSRELLQIVALDAGVELSEPLLDRIMDLADFYLQGSQLPGRAISLLRHVFEVRGTGAFTVRDLLLTLHESTGIPVDFLDDERSINLTHLLDFFEKRVMGQPRAIQSVLDLVTLIKAGLTDPHRPNGVLLFVGPTGVGKTELARTVAALLFGDPARLVRFDMSEYATDWSYERLIGQGTQPGLLTSAVREAPFSVLLFDEIEKANANVFDLCLQIFDAGRLTDTQGRTADFRNTIIIMTSNVGSNIPTENQVGFAGMAAPPPESDDTLREVHRFFRPEFLNRIDRIVCFDPLAIETAERIARAEVTRVIDRNGIARRQLTLDVSDEVVAHLVKLGYSPAFGVRPLKRTVEQHVLLPVARVLAEGSVPSGSILRLVMRETQVEVEIVDRVEAEEENVADDPVELQAIRDRVQELSLLAKPIEDRKTKLIEESNQPEFWKHRGSALRTLDQIHRLDRLLSDLKQLRSHLRLTECNRSPERVAAYTVAHRREADRLAFLFSCDDLGDAILSVTRIKAQTPDLGGVERLTRMYQGFAQRRGLELEIVDDRTHRNATEHSITAFLSGAGAYAMLKGETGLHQLSQSSLRLNQRDPKDIVRVEVLRVPTDAAPLPANDLRIECRSLAESPGSFLLPNLEIRILHLPTMISLCAWCNTPQDQALEKLRSILKARIDYRKSGSSAESRSIVRRYRLGTSPLVRDRRSGRTTGRAEQILSGDLDLFLAK